MAAQLHMLSWKCKLALHGHGSPTQCKELFLKNLKARAFTANAEDITGSSQGQKYQTLHYDLSHGNRHL